MYIVKLHVEFLESDLLVVWEAANIPRDTAALAVFLEIDMQKRRRDSILAF